MIKNIVKILSKDAKGQALVMVALAMTALIGFTAITVDYGNLAWQKRQLQNAADAAALAGAQSLINVTQARDEAKKYAQENGFTITNSDIETPYDGNSEKIKVTITKTFQNTFARILNINESTLTASAVAQKKSIWNGEALPFINLTFDYSTTDPAAWTMVGPGVKGTTADFYVRNTGTQYAYYEVDYLDGITYEMGYSNPSALNGPQELKLRTDIKTVLRNEDKNNKKFYLFSLRSKFIKEGSFTVNNGDPRSLDQLNKLKNGDVIDPHQLVLIEVLLIDFKEANRTDLELTFLGNVFDLGFRIEGEEDLPDFPTENLSSGGSSKLVQ